MNSPLHKSAPIDVSVIICTWNRADLLRQTLLHFRRLIVPANISWELVIVNNRCTDHTDRVVNEFTAQLPIRLLHEDRAGKSFAANFAIEQSRGDLLLWTDDDALVDPHWLSQYLRCMQDYPTAMYFGGPVEPWFSESPPTWLTRNFEDISCAFATRRIGQDTRPINVDEYPYGVNMAMRREALAGETFDVRVGPSLDSHVRGEDVLLIDRFKERGLLGIWAANARVEHYIPRERLTMKYVWSFYYGQGRTAARLGTPTKVPYLFGLPRWTIKKYALHSAKAWFYSIAKGRRWISEIKAAAWHQGFMREMRLVSDPRQRVSV
jgi:glycosyltransferase involved in cell wall biosynthesis